jgi:nitrilase
VSFDGVSGTLTVAAVQTTPVFLDRAATVEVAARHVALANAELVVFPESFVPGYPDWVWRRSPMSDGDWYARLIANAVRVDSTDLDLVATLLAMPVPRLRSVSPSDRARTRLYNTVVYIGSTGEVVARHRKLVPTGAERLVWANGNDHLLTVIDVAGVKVGALICWENYMPLARVAMYERGIDVLLAPTWDNSDEWVPTLRHIAKEGQIFVVGVTAFLRGSDVPRDLSDAADLYGG